MKKYYLTINYKNGTTETHNSNSENYIKRLINRMYDESGAIYEVYWNAQIFCNVPGHGFLNDMI